MNFDFEISEICEDSKLLRYQKFGINFNFKILEVFNFKISEVRNNFQLLDIRSVE